MPQFVVVYLGGNPPSSPEEGQKHFAEAGTDKGGHWTPFKQTCLEVRAMVTSNPGISAKDLVNSIKHHYKTERSAMGSLAKWTREGVVPGVALRNGRYYPKDK